MTTPPCSPCIAPLFTPLSPWPPQVKLAIATLQTIGLVPAVYGLDLPGYYYDWMRFLKVAPAANDEPKTRSVTSRALAPPSHINPPDPLLEAAPTHCTLRVQLVVSDLRD